MGKQKESTNNFGVMISNKAWKDISKNKPSYRLRQLAIVNSSVNFNMYFFNIKQVDEKTKLITGYYYNPSDDTWKTGIFPYPDILYRRGGATLRDKERFYAFIRSCTKKGTVFLNPTPLGNWQIYNYFNNVKSLQKYLLETILYKKPKDLINMLNKHKTVYLKGVTGRKGKNVMRISMISDTNFIIKNYSHRKDEVRINRYNNTDDIVSFIKNFYKEKDFIVQEAIKLLELDNRIIDLRAELQRNKRGEIDISGVSARVSQKNSPITVNSVAYPIDEFFKNINLSFIERIKIKRNIKNFLHLVYKETEKEYGKFSEIGIDFGLTKDFEIKFIECNSQSAKVSLLKAYGEKRFNHALLNILESAKYEIENKKQSELQEQTKDVQEKQRVIELVKMKSTEYWNGLTKWFTNKWKKLKEGVK